MIPPKGFKNEMFPLRHRLVYSAGLSSVTATTNSTMFTLVKNYLGSDLPSTVETNPKSGSFVAETGAICTPMSIIDKLTLSLRFNMTSIAWNTDKMHAFHFLWRPIFFSFVEKLDAADMQTTTTVKSILSLTSNSTNEDVTPAFASKLATAGSSELAHPVSTVNFAEVFGTLNLTTDTSMEGVPHNEDTFQKALKYYTNKGALKACVGRTRHVTLTRDKVSANFFLKKFVPKSIRRIMPYTFFAILIHVPILGEVDQYYNIGAGTATSVQLGCKAVVNYHEWNHDHNQDIVA